MIEKKYYVCDCCGSRYEDRAECEQCESSHKTNFVIESMSFVSRKRNVDGFPSKLIARDSNGEKAIYRRVAK